jgi:hypothetical protein
LKTLRKNEALEASTDASFTRSQLASPDFSGVFEDGKAYFETSCTSW